MGEEIDVSLQRPFKTISMEVYNYLTGLGVSDALIGVVLKPPDGSLDIFKQVDARNMLFMMLSEIKRQRVFMIIEELKDLPGHGDYFKIIDPEQYRIKRYPPQILENRLLQYSGSHWIEKLKRIRSYFKEYADCVMVWDSISYVVLENLSTVWKNKAKKDVGISMVAAELESQGFPRRIIRQAFAVTNIDTYIKRGRLRATEQGILLGNGNVPMPEWLITIVEEMAKKKVKFPDKQEISALGRIEPENPDIT